MSQELRDEWNTHHLGLSGSIAGEAFHGKAAISLPQGNRVLGRHNTLRILWTVIHKENIDSFNNTNLNISASKYKDSK